MKKYSLIVVCLLLCSVLLSGCQPTQNQQTIKYERKLEKYVSNEYSQNNKNGAIDLSDGTKLKYNANFGPSDLSFDIKIVNPY